MAEDTDDSQLNTQYSKHYSQLAADIIYKDLNAASYKCINK